MNGKDQADRPEAHGYKRCENEHISTIDMSNELKKKFPKDPICPQYWGGYDILPSYFEFWQMGDHRLHDRIIYKTHGSNTWKILCLYP